MKHAEFESLLTQALIRSARETWLEQPSEEALRKIFPDTKMLDDRVRRITAPEYAPMMAIRPPLYRRLLRYVAMFFLSLSILFGALMLYPEARQIIINLVVTWYEDHIKYSFQKEDTTANPQNWEFGYIPEGFTLFLEERKDTSCRLKYERSDGALFFITVSQEAGARYADNEHYNIDRIVFRNGIADTYESTDDKFSNMIIWYREEFDVLVTVLGDVPLEELLCVLEHMTP